MEQNQEIQSSAEGQPSSISTKSSELNTGDIIVPPPSADDSIINHLNENRGSEPQDNPTMEAHHHGHVHHEKKWKEYFFQFFMLFLAVFCSFLAEYQLEHKIEKDRAEEFAASLVTDLEKDTTSIKSQILFRERIYRSADSMMHFLKDGLFDKNTDQSVRNFTRIRGMIILRTYRGTIDQLKASGSLRYFKNKQLTTSLIDYYTQLNEVDHRIQFIFDYTSEKLSPFAIAHFDSRYTDTLFRRRKNVLPFRNMGEEEQIQLYNMSSALYGLNRALAVTVLPTALKDAEQLINLIKKEYNWEAKKY